MFMNTKKTLKSKQNHIDSGVPLTLGALSTFAALMITLSICNDRALMRKNYTPGESLKRTERAAVDSLHDSRLNYDITRYQRHLSTYRKLIDESGAATGAEAIKQPIPAHIAKNVCPFDAEPTIGDYYDFLKRYEARIEAQYQRLAKQK